LCPVHYSYLFSLSCALFKCLSVRCGPTRVLCPIGASCFPIPDCIHLRAEIYISSFHVGCISKIMFNKESVCFKLHVDSRCFDIEISLTGRDESAGPTSNMHTIPSNPGNTFSSQSELPPPFNPRHTQFLPKVSSHRIIVASLLQILLTFDVVRHSTLKMLSPVLYQVSFPKIVFLICFQELGRKDVTQIHDFHTP
jgi:hypothetical protein